MRSVLNISMPQKLKEEVELAVEKGGYATKSEFLRDLIRVWREETLFQNLQKSRRQFDAGKGKKLKSLKDLR